VKTLLGRVPVQVKGSATSRELKEKRQTASFPVKQEVLLFFRRNSGGMYFYVPMCSDGTKPVVFYAVLTPYKIDRVLEKMREGQKEVSIQLKKLPPATAQIERIVGLALEGQKQGKTTGFDERRFAEAKSFTIHSLVDIAEDRPTVFNLDKTDFAVTLNTIGGLSYAVDMDLTVYPGSYMPRIVEATVSCGEVEFTQLTAKQTAPKEMEIQLSEGLRLQVQEGAGTVRTTLNVTAAGDLRTQVRNLDLLLAASHGAPLVVAGRSHTPEFTSLENASEIQSHRDQIAQILELFDAFGLDDAIINTVEITEGDVATLRALHNGIVLNEEVGATTDGFGRYDFTIGRFKIMTVIAPGSTSNVTKIIDPFDPDKRAQFRIYRVAKDNSTEELDHWGTVYEPMLPAELATTLNLRLTSIVRAYEALEDDVGARATANQTVLHLLQAADSVTGAHRDYLLKGAADLCDWLIEHRDDVLLYKINRWQVEHRRGRLSPATQKEIRLARRALSQTDDRELRNACLTILLDDRDELDVILESLPPADVEKLQSWPIWKLAEPAAEPAVARDSIDEPRTVDDNVVGELGR